MSKIKNGDVNNSPILTLVIGVVFLLGGGATVALTIKDGFTWVVWVGLLLLGCGLFIVIYGIIRAKQISKVKAMLKDPSAYETTAHFVKAAFAGYTSRSTSVGSGNVQIPTSFNLRVFKKIVYTYKDLDGIEHKAKSVYTYSLNQAK